MLSSSSSEPGYVAPDILPSSSSVSGPTAAAAAVLASSLASRVSSSSYDNGSGGIQTPAEILAAATADKMARRRRGRSQCCWSMVTIGVALASMGSAAMAMYLEQSFIVYIAFGIPLLIAAPTVLIQTWRLQGLSPLWLRRNAIRSVQYQLHRINAVHQMFQTEVTRLKAEQEDLQDVEQQLEQVVRGKGGDMREMKRLIRDHGRIQQQMKRLVAAEEFHHLMTLMLHSDVDRDFVFTEKEIDQLFVRLKAFGVVDQTRLRSVLQTASTKSFNRLYKAAAQDFTNSRTNGSGATATATDPLSGSTTITGCHDDNVLASAFDYVLPWEK